VFKEKHGGRDMTEVTRKDRQTIDRAWTGLDHETAVRMSGRAYRPDKVYDRPQLSERRAGKPGAHDEGQK
jgi:hypothetical protein